MEATRRAARIERTGPVDLMYLALQHASIPAQFGALLVLEPAERFDAAAATRLLAARIRAVHRMRERVMTVPPGCGRSIWIDDGDFDVERHIEYLTCPQPGDDRALLQLAADLVLRPLPLDQPLWTAAFISGLTRGRVALVIIVQHALLDGMGGLAVLGALLDGAPAPITPAFPVPPPSAAALAADALFTGARALVTMPQRLRASARRQRRQRGRRIGRALRCSLLRPTGRRRRVSVASAQLSDLRYVAHRYGATVNDVILSAIGGALHSCLEGRGEQLADVVVGMPVSVRRTATAEAPENHFTELRALVPGTGGPVERLKRVSTVMRVRKQAAMGPAAGALAAAAVRAAVALGVYDWYMRRQRYLHTSVTNVRGPELRQTFAGAPITRILPLTAGSAGNVTVSFAALSYANTLTVTLTADPDTMPDLAATTAALQVELDTLISCARMP